MLASNTPPNFPIPFANSAGVGYIRTIPTASQISITPGAASLTDGFPPLNFIPEVAGGVPPFGQDVNGIFKEITQNVQWKQAGGIYSYDSAFSTAIGGYPNRAMLRSADGTGWWISQVDNNLTNPETGGANWLPSGFSGNAAITMTNVDVTLTLNQYCRPIIIITGTLINNLNLIFPASINGEWLIDNDTTGAFAITCKTATGAGVIVPQGYSSQIYGDGIDIKFQDDIIQSGAMITAVAGGTADALTATFNPTITVLANQTVFVEAAFTNATTTPTINPGSGIITIVKGNNLPLTAGDIAGSGHWLELKLDATLGKAVLLNPANGIIVPTAIAYSFKKLKIDAIGINNYNCVITADSVILENSSGQYLLQESINKTINANGTVGAPLSIMSARAASTYYYRWLWYNATNGLTATLDISSTAPTAPTGYVSTDYKALLPGACFTDASGSTYLMNIITRDKISQYELLAGSNTAGFIPLAAGVAGNPATGTYVAVAISPAAPPTACEISITLNSQGVTMGAMAAPSNNYGSATAAYNPPPISLSDATGNIFIQSGKILLESTNIYWASSHASALLLCTGWRDL